MKSDNRRFYMKAFLVLTIPVVLIQFIPYGRNHTNPPVIEEPRWDSQQCRGLVQRACYDCHSNETNWPWYSFVAPISWQVQIDVEEGRQEVNFSEWNRPAQDTRDLVRNVYINHMPPPDYQFIHSSSRYTPEERQFVVTCFQKMFPQ